VKSQSPVNAHRLDRRYGRRRRIAAGVLAGLLALSAVAGLGQALTSCRPANSTAPTIPDR
jgi:hypothetical protein